jgi:hypothetical protein
MLYHEVGFITPILIAWRRAEECRSRKEGMILLFVDID